MTVVGMTDIGSETGRESPEAGGLRASGIRDLLESVFYAVSITGIRLIPFSSTNLRSAYRMFWF